MVCSITGNPMYLIEGTCNQYHQANINNLPESSYPKIFLINSTIRPIHNNTTPPKPVTTIGFGPHCHTPETTNFLPTYPVYQNIQQESQLVFTGCQIIAGKKNSDTPLLEENEWKISKILPLLHNPTLKDDTLIAQNISR